MLLYSPVMPILPVVSIFYKGFNLLSSQLFRLSRALAERFMLELQLLQ